MAGTVLVMTVGGSHEPLLEAIRVVQPDFVLFVCSNDNPLTRAKGSYTQILGEGKFIKAKFTDAKPTLENVPSQAGLAEDAFSVVHVNTDDIDQSYNIISIELKRLVSEFDKVVCDYTGGTKSMSSSLVLAAVDNEEFSRQVVAGARGNLRRVETGFQNVSAAKVGGARFRSSFDNALSNWTQYNYSSALNDLDKLKPTGTEDDDTLQIAKFACKAFVDWDVFNHEEAKKTLSYVSKRLGPEYSAYLKQLGLMCSDSRLAMPSLILDLWLNAQRCASRHRYDDATARVYRLIEWCSQWILKSQKDIDTADVPESMIPPGFNISFNENKKKYEAALVPSWDLAAEICDDNTKMFWKKNKEEVIDLLRVRNNSVLAHGFDPISESQWRDINQFAGQRLIPFMMGQFEQLKISELPKQLPTHWES